jgi:hypothetical protein
MTILWRLQGVLVTNQVQSAAGGVSAGICVTSGPLSSAMTCQAQWLGLAIVVAA